MTKFCKAGIVALLLAAGSGTRMLSKIPKQYYKVAGKAILRHTIEKFLVNTRISMVQVVISEEHVDLYNEAIAGLNLPNPIIGGATRQESVRKGLEAISSLDPDKVIIHDAVRLLVSSEQIDAVIDALISGYDAIDSVLPIVNSVRHQQNGQLQNIGRDSLYSVQTPQGFRYEAILDVHRKLRGSSFTDDVAMCIEQNLNVGIVSGCVSNIKITLPSDLLYAKCVLENKRIIRTGIGFDVHRFSDRTNGNAVIKICGVPIAHDCYIDAHSDGDVGLHAITEAILGAIACGNIGTHFPNNDSRWKDADSMLFVKKAFDLLTSNGGQINNIDVTIICEMPKIMPHSLAMRENIASALHIDIAQVSIKATTTENMGFLGRKEGIAAQAICTVEI